MVVRMPNVPQLARIDAAAVGVLGHMTASGLPNAVAVTPYVVDGALVVTSTLALIDKAKALLVEPRVSLSAGGVSVSGSATVEVDPTPRYFDRYIRGQELVKYPPARSLLSVPFHRTLLPWYVGRVIIRIHPETVTEEPCGDGTTVTAIDATGQLRTLNVPRPTDLNADRIEIAVPVPDGPALVLVHEEDAAMRDLRQLRRRGTVHDGVLHVSARRGSLAPSSKSATDELRSLRALARAARTNRARLATWPHYEPPKEPTR
jgi:hypothetical protein